MLIVLRISFKYNIYIANIVNIDNICNIYNIYRITAVPLSMPQPADLDSALDSS